MPERGNKEQICFEIDLPEPKDIAPSCLVPIVPEEPKEEPIPREEHLKTQHLNMRNEGIIKLHNLMSQENSGRAFAQKLQKQQEDYEKHARYTLLSEQYGGITSEQKLRTCKTISDLAAFVMEVSMCFFCEVTDEKNRCFIRDLSARYGHRHAYEHGLKIWWSSAKHDRQPFQRALKKDPRAICFPYKPNPFVDK